jgi:glutamyl-tRNA reductase
MSDIIVVSTSSDEPTIKGEHISTDKALLVLDLSIPSNVKIDIEKYPNVTLINVDELSKITDDTLAIRKREIPKAEAIIQDHKGEFTEWVSHRKYAPAINALKDSLLNIKEEQLNFHRKNLNNFDEEQAEIVTTKLIQKITTKFARHFKDEKSTVDENMELILKVFGQ